jgi:crotonobetainyl-CoA:carnitine CoA-transferase CaiB-like acyl-CoA transferase
MAVGILAALHARQQNNEGQKIEVSMQEAVLGFMVSSMHQYFTGNSVGTRPIQVADGHFTLRIPEISNDVWPVLARAIDRADLLDDQRFSTNAARRQHRGELEEIVQAWARAHTRQEIWQALRDIGYFGAPVLSIGEVLEDPHIEARQAFIVRQHPTAGPTTLLSPWIRMSMTPSSIRQDAPAIGQHTDEVLSGLLGLPSTELADLRARGIVK